MRHLTNHTTIASLLRIAAATLSTLLVSVAQAAAPGIYGNSFDLTAEPAFISQPDGASVYSWGYGCASGSLPSFVPAAIGLDQGANCPSMQIPGPTLVVTKGQTVTVTLHNNLPSAAGNTSILFPGFTMMPFTDGTPGILTQEAAPGGSVTYTFAADKEGTHAYYSGTQGDLQVEMGLFGTIIVLPSSIPANCASTADDQVKAANGESDYRLAPAAYNHEKACYDREYLFQFSEMDPRIHRQAEEQVVAHDNCVAATVPGTPPNCPGLHIDTEPYHPAYFMMNGRSFPDNLDPNYASQYPHQPYNANPHTHPGELTLVRETGTGRWQHPFHEHANHLRLLARDGNLLLTAPSASHPDGNLAGPLLFTTTSTPGESLDAMFYWSGKGLGWDAYGHGTSGEASVYHLADPTDTTDPNYARLHAMYVKYNGQPFQCHPDANGYYTADSTPPAPFDAPNYFEWCEDHGKPLEAHPFGLVGSGGPVTLPDPNILTNGAWYGGSPYLGPEATQRAVGSTPIPPSGTVANSPTDEAGYAYMWHSHNERELTTNNIFPGGMMTLLLVDPRSFQIDESK